MKKILFCFFISVSVIHAYAVNTPEEIVRQFGEAISTWCNGGNMTHRMIAASLCNGLKSCRVEDKIHSDYQTSKGFFGYDTFVLDSYLNMFQSNMIKGNGLKYMMENIKVEDTDYIDGQTLTFLTADIEISGEINGKVKDLFLVRDDKISGIYNYSSQLGFSHLNGELIRALKIGQYVRTNGFKNGYATVVNEVDHWGLIDLKGNVIIPCIWDCIEYEGTELVTAYNNTGKFISIQGYLFKDLNMETCVYDLRNNAKQTPFHDVRHSNIVESYTSPSDFSDGLALVQSKIDWTWGFLDEGDFSYKDIDYNYLFANKFSNERAIIITKDERTAIIDKNLKEVWESNDRYNLIGKFYEGFAPICDNITNLWGFLDVNGKFIINPQFYDVGRFKNGFCWASIRDKNGEIKYGVINKKGIFVIPPDFDAVNLYVNHKIYVENNYIPLYKTNSELEWRCSLIGIGGKPLPGFNWEYNDIGYFNEGLATCQKNFMWGYLSKSGNLAVPLIYTQTYDIKNGYGKVRKKDKYGFINNSGILVIPCIYDDASNFEDGIALVKKDGKVGLIDRFGNSSFFEKDN